jgi:hypothetical protein
MQLEGKCPCGRVQYRIQGEPIVQLICHCPSCQLAHAAAMVPGAQFATENFEVSGPIRAVAVTQEPEATRRMTCELCGTRMFNVGDPRVRTIFPASCNRRDWFKPQMHLYWANRRVDVVDDLPKYLDFPLDFGGTGRRA